MDPAINKYDQWSGPEREVEVSNGYFYLDLSLIMYPVILKFERELLFHAGRVGA